MIRKVPAQVTYANLIAKSADLTVAKVRLVSEIRNRLTNGMQVLKAALMYMLRVELCDLELLFALEVHHEDVKRIGARQLAILNLRGDYIH